MFFREERKLTMIQNKKVKITHTRSHPSLLDEDGRLFFAPFPKNCSLSHEIFPLLQISSQHNLSRMMKSSLKKSSLKEWNYLLMDDNFLFPTFFFRKNTCEHY